MVCGADLSLGRRERSIVRLRLRFTQPGISQESSALEVCQTRVRLSTNNPGQPQKRQKAMTIPTLINRKTDVQDGSITSGVGGGEGGVNTKNSVLPVSRMSATWHHASGIHRSSRVAAGCQ